MFYNCEGLSFQILTVDRFLHKAGTFDVPARTYAALSYRVAGRGVFETQGKHLCSRPGDILFIPANTPYTAEYSGGESIVVHFSDCNYHEAESLTPTGTESIGALFSHLLNEWNERRSVNRTKAAIYTLLARIEEDRTGPTEDPALAACLAFMEEHFTDPELRMEDVCAAGFVSPSGLLRGFIKQFGISPKQYLIKLRMKRALELLMAGGLPVGEVSASCGFSDTKYFARTFKKHYGYPPSHLHRHILV